MDPERAGIEERLALHHAFWRRCGQARPLASFRIGDFFFSRHFEAARPLLVRGRPISADLLDPRDYLPDYERMFADSERIRQDGFWTAEPFTGLPWMEAILGCPVRAGEEAFTTRPVAASPWEAAEAAEAVLAGLLGSHAGDWLESPDGEPGRRAARNPWLSLYLSFTHALVELGRGRFTVGQPITRGTTDMAGALLGQEAMIFALADDPQDMARLAAALTGVFLRVLELQRELVPAFLGGSALGFYHVWAPGPSLWFQDDLSAVLSPGLYREFFLPCVRRICRTAGHTAVHLHPSSFFLLDDLLRLEELRVVQVNKDVGGPSVEEMMPVLERILQRKGLILWGDLTLEELEQVRRRLPADGLFLHIVAPDLESAREMNARLRAWV